MSNPFERLGLSRDVVDNLYKSNRLQDFLKEHYRKLQLRLHPDKGGDTALAAIVNEAFREITSHPEQIELWLQQMQEPPEYLEIIADLTAEVERLQAVEEEYTGGRHDRKPPEDTLQKKEETVTTAKKPESTPKKKGSIFRRLINWIMRKEKTEEPEELSETLEQKVESEPKEDLGPNPFEQLGLHKETVAYLYQAGQLETFLKAHYQRLQSYGGVEGNGVETKVVPESFERIIACPAQIGNWIKSMGCRSTEYLEVITGLTAEVERLQKVEQEYREKREKAAQAVVEEITQKTLYGKPAKTASSSDPGIRSSPGPTRIVRRTPAERKLMVREFLNDRYLDTDVEVVHVCAEDEPYIKASRGDCLLFYSAEPIRNSGDFKKIWDFEGEFFVPRPRVYALQDLIKAGTSPRTIIERLELEETFEREIAAYIR